MQNLQYRQIAYKVVTFFGFDEDAAGDELMRSCFGRRDQQFVANTQLRSQQAMRAA